MFISTQQMRNDMVYWITEREKMRKDKESGNSFPHSLDPIMANNRFCNVRRKDDKVTVWLRDNWYHNNDGFLLERMVLARLLNNIPCLVSLPPFWMEFDSEMDRIEDILFARKNEGLKVFGSAYVVTTCGVAMEKIDYVLDIVKEVYKQRMLGRFNWSPDTTLKQAHEELTRVDGLGDFIGAQIIADLKNNPNSDLIQALDWRTFSAPGPGSLKGLSAYFNQNVTKSQYHVAIKQQWDEIRPLLPPELQDLHMQDFQNCNCEFSKYHRIKYEGGRAKCGYDGTERL